VARRSARKPIEVREQPLIDSLLRPVKGFVLVEAASGVLLLIVSVVALVWANSPWAQSYIDLFETSVRLGVDGWAIEEDIRHWINDGLMVIFFLVVGLEIKREVLVGELTSLRRAALPIAAAMGGMAVPAALYLAFNPDGPGQHGWGVPMATDIAFTLGILALLGNRVPSGLKLFLAALAIADDLGAVLVIAIFYTPALAWGYLAAAGATLVALRMLNRLGVRSPLPYSLLGVVLWLTVLESGVHATVAGVVLAMTIPVHARIGPGRFTAAVQGALPPFEQDAMTGDEYVEATFEQRRSLQTIQDAVARIDTPLHRMENALLPWSAFGILPLFALANAGVDLRGVDLASLALAPVTLGVMAGLVVGKPIGIVGLSALAVRSGLAEMPSGVNWRHIVGVACLAGVGFTMSLFIANLAFEGTELLAAAKVGTLAGSAVAGLIGYALLLCTARTPSLSAERTLSEPE